MVTNMIGPRHDFKICDSVVKFVAVFVVDNLRWFQWSSYMIFHYFAMCPNVFAVARQQEVSAIVHKARPVKQQFVWVAIPHPSAIVHHTHAACAALVGVVQFVATFNDTLFDFCSFSHASIITRLRYANQMV